MGLSCLHEVGRKEAPVLSQPEALPSLPVIPSGLQGPHFPPIHMGNSRTGPLSVCFVLSTLGGDTELTSFPGHMSPALYLPLGAWQRVSTLHKREENFREV